MLEDDLKSALRRVDPPAGFEQRVLSRIHGESSSPRRATANRLTAWATAAALACASFAGVAVYRHQQEQQRGAMARDQLLLALQITGKKLDAVRTRINSTNEAQIH